MNWIRFLIINKSRRYFFVLLIFFLCLIDSQLANANATKNNIISNGEIESIKVGDSVSKIFSVFETKYQIKKEYLTVKLLKKGKLIVVFDLDDHEKILLIDIYAHYITEKKIGCGSKLSDLIKTYGQGKIDPADSGYFIWFERQKGIMFLLNNEDIPKELRNIPDDAIKPEDEKKIMSLKNAKISVIRMFKTFKEDSNKDGDKFNSKVHH